MAGHVRLQRKVTADYYPNWKSCPQRQRRLQVEVAARDLLADLIDGVLHALARGDDNAAVGVHPIGRDQLGTDVDQGRQRGAGRSEEHTSELQSLMRSSYAVFCLNKKKKTNT